MSINEIKKILLKRIRRYGEYGSDRMLMRCYFSLTTPIMYVKRSAEKKAANIISQFLIIGYNTMIPKYRILKTCSYIRKLQLKWKSMIKLNFIRKLVLKSQLKEMILRLMNTKGKKNPILQKRLIQISESTIDKIINNFYNEQKRKYFKQLTQTFNKRFLELVFYD